MNEMAKSHPFGSHQPFRYHQPWVVFLFGADSGSDPTRAAPSRSVSARGVGTTQEDGSEAPAQRQAPATQAAQAAGATDGAARFLARVVVDPKGQFGAFPSNQSNVYCLSFWGSFDVFFFQLLKRFRLKEDPPPISENPSTWILGSGSLNLSCLVETGGIRYTQD